MGSFTQKAPSLPFHPGSATETGAGQLALRWAESLHCANAPLEEPGNVEGEAGLLSREQGPGPGFPGARRLSGKPGEVSSGREGHTCSATDTGTFQPQACSWQAFVFIHSQD